MQCCPKCGFDGYPFPCPEPEEAPKHTNWIYVDYSVCLQCDPCVHTAAWHGYNEKMTDARTIVNKLKELGQPVPEHFHYLLSKDEIEAMDKKHRPKSKPKVKRPRPTITKPAARRRVAH